MSERPRLNLETVSHDKANRYGSQMPKCTSRLSQSSPEGKGLLALYTVCILAHWKGCAYQHWGLHSGARHRIDKVSSVHITVKSLLWSSREIKRACSNVLQASSIRNFLILLMFLRWQKYIHILESSKICVSIFSSLTNSSPLLCTCPADLMVTSPMLSISSSAFCDNCVFAKKMNSVFLSFRSQAITVSQRLMPPRQHSLLDVTSSRQPLVGLKVI